MPGRLLYLGFIDSRDPAALGRLTGGILYDHRVCGRFASAGWDVVLFDFDTLPKHVTRLRFPVARALRPRLDEGFDVLMTDLGNSSLTPGIQRRARASGLLSVVICHHFRSRLERSHLKRLMYAWTERFTVREADLLVANSASTAGRIGELGRGGADVVLARPGLSVALAGSPVYNETPSELLLVGNVEARKGILDAVRALGCSGADGVGLVIAGEESYEPEYRESVDALLSSLGLGDRVRFTGRIGEERLEAAYRHADVFFLPSLWEGYGMAIAEAMASGLPVVSTTAGAIPDLVEHGVSGLLVEPGDWRAAGAALKAVLGDGGLRRRLAEGALRSAASFPSWEDSTGLVLRAVEERTRR
jgi:glycosyltransferase involved in cell wall biosynthesis